MADQTQSSTELVQLRRALVALREMRARLEAVEKARREPIAIVGYSCRLPGGANNPALFWELLKAERTTITDTPPDRYDIEMFYDPDREATGKIVTRRASYVDDIYGFDPLFFGISPREAVTMDPQQRMLLELIWEALEDAAIAPDSIAGTETGVFAGVSMSDYHRMAYADNRLINGYTGTGTNNGALAGRLSYQLGVHGPSFAIDTACSSTLVAVHQAVVSLRSGESDMALAGGASALLAPGIFITFSKAQMLGEDGLCKTFDADANGYVRGEGGGMFVLKRLSDAEADGDIILGLIRGSAVNQDGRSNGLTAPNGLAQAACIRTALKNAGLQPAEVNFLEAHGTGTKLGDPIEVEALGSVFNEGRSPDDPLLISSVKANIGHLEGSSGAASLAKVLLALEHKEIPAHVNYKTPNPLIPWDQLYLKVADEATPWQSGDRPRIAGISGYGFGGTNAHILVQEAPPAPVREGYPERPRHLVALSAKSEAALKALAERYATFLREHPDVSLGDVSHTSIVGRAHFVERAAVVAADAAEAAAAMDAIVNGRRSAATVAGRTQSDDPGVVFLFTGQGSQYIGMGRQLYGTQPVFRNALDECDRLLQPYLERSLLSVIFADEGSEAAALLDETAYTQPALFAIEYALAQLWLDWGVKPAAVVGHSVGEYVAACIAGVFSLEDGLRLIAARGRLMQSLPHDGSMAALQLDEAAAKALIADKADIVSFAAINGPRSVVISGDKEAVEGLAADLKEAGTKTKVLTVSHAFHSHLMDPILDAFEAEASAVTFRPAQIPLVSNVTGQLVDDDQILGPRYWRDHIRAAVRFADAMHVLHDEGYEIFLEVGPAPVLLGMGRECLPKEVGVWLPSLRKNRDDWYQMLKSLGEAYVAGVSVNGVAFNRDYGYRRLRLPTYPFQRQQYALGQVGFGVPQVGDGIVGGTDTGHPLLGSRLRSALDEKLFDNVLRSDRPAYLVDHQLYGAVVVPGAAFMETALAAATAAFGPGAHRLTNVTIQEPMVLPEDADVPMQVIVKPEGATRASFRLVSQRDERDWRTHATGALMLEAGDATLLDAQSLDDIRARLRDEVDMSDFYTRLKDVGLGYGPAFRGVAHMWRGDNETLGEIRLPAGLTADGYALHPALLDASFHPGLLLSTLPGLGTAEDDGGAGDIYIPVGLEQYTVHQTGAERLWSHVALRPSPSGTTTVYTADIRFFDDDGNLVAEMAGLVLQRAPREALRRALQRDHGNWLYEFEWEASPRDGESPFAGEPAGAWLILADDLGVADGAAAQLAQHGETCVMVKAGAGFAESAAGAYTIDPLSPADMARLLDEALPAGHTRWRGVAHAWALDVPVPNPIEPDSLDDIIQPATASALHLAQALGRLQSGNQPRLWLVTRGSQAIDGSETALAPEQAPVWGLGNTIALELPDLHCVRLDLEPGAVEGNADLLAEALWAPDDEDRVAFRGHGRFVARLIRSADRQTTGLTVPDTPYELDITDRGILDNLVLKTVERREPGPGEVEIRVRATGLNFRDVLKGLGMYPDAASLGWFGDECAGDVVAVGEGVTHVAVGDAVFGMASGSFSRFVTTTADFIVRKPDNISYAEAATIPVTFLTAYYALHHIGRLQAGERVLVHAASGGVGMAATQLVQRAGAEVFGTASLRKWDVLRGFGIKHIMNSRTLDFSAEILAATDGAGVDLVLNSLNGDFIPKSLAAMTDNGRFLEIGKVGIWSADEVAAVKPDALYAIIFLDEVRREEPALVREMLLEITAAMADGSLKPLRHHLFSIEKISDAFRFMAQAKHVGKIVITHPVDDGSDEESGLLQPNASYLVTGGLGGLGLTVARWMADQGARNLVLVGRSAPKEHALPTLQALEEAGVNVHIARGDIGQAADVERILTEVNQTLPPLRGIIHAAGVLDDGVLSELNIDRFRRVMGPKVDGAWLLHSMTRNQPLDFFVLFSSVTSVLGAAGQGNYVAANAFLDTLAHQRRADGRPAISISWGPWGEVGMAASIERSRWKRQGMEPLPPEDGVEAMEQILQRDPAHVTVLDIEWPAFMRTLAHIERPAYLSELVQDAATETQAETAGPAAATLLSLLEEVPADEARNIVIDFIRDQARMVFGLSPDFPIDPRQSFNELGLDSLMAVELRNALGSSVQQVLPATLLYDYPTIATLANYLLTDLLGYGGTNGAATTAEREAEAEAAAEAAASEVAELESISEDEAEALLLQELLGSQDSEG